MAKRSNEHQAEPAAPPAAPDPSGTGYGWNKKDIVQTEDRELGPEAIPPKRPRQPPAIATQPARDASGGDLLRMLVETGTNPERIKDASAWLLSSPDANAETLFRYLETAEDQGDLPISPGTLRKAGKWLWGPTWEPESAILLSPNEEIARLRTQIATLEQQLKIKDAERLGLHQQITYFRTQNQTLTQQVDFLRLGRDPSELAGMGIGAPVANSLASAGNPGATAP